MPVGEAVEEFALVRDFAIIMAVAGGVVAFFHRIKQPPILGYLLAGLIIGPFTLPSPPITNIENIRLLADLGLVLLLFALGLEFGWRRIRQVGLSVLIIGAIQTLGMISLGYAVGKLLGWTGRESLFLGSALSISSSAILVKVLRDTGRLTSTSGRLIVGILVVEDFVAVILLTLLSGMATSSGAELSDVGFLVAKLTIFGVSSLALGAVFVPQIIKFVHRYGSRETMLLTSLALCFVLALIGQTLGVSAAAGAFLIGAVVGDTEESGQITEIIEPIRDMFGALFFVSIGMLVDVRLIKDYLVPAAVISLVFMVGKIVGNTAATFVTGYGGRVSLQVGMGMPQIGEFSLAMMKVGVEHNIIGAFTYQIVVAVTAINSLVYPYVARSADTVAGFLRRRSPSLLRRSVFNLSTALQAFSGGVRFDTEFARRIRRAIVPIAINLLIIVVFVSTGTVAVGFAADIEAPLGVSRNIVGNIIGLGTLALCIPSAIGLWRGLQHLADEATRHLVVERRVFRISVEERLRNVIRDTISVVVIFVVGLWSIPLLAELLSLGSLAAPVPLAVLAFLAFVSIGILTRMHGQLVNAFSRTFLGGPEGASHPAPPAASPSQEPSPAEAGSETPEPPALAAHAAPEAAPPLPAVAGLGAQPGTPAPVSIGEAEMIALSTVSQDRSPYRGRINGRNLAWDIKESAQATGYYRVTLTFYEAGSQKNDAGEEELYVDHRGAVRFRQVRRWPSRSSRRTLLLLLLGGSVAVLLAAGLAVGMFILVY